MIFIGRGFKCCGFVFIFGKDGLREGWVDEDYFLLGFLGKEVGF